jgi:hypothetical protein
MRRLSAKRCTLPAPVRIDAAREWGGIGVLVEANPQWIMAEGNHIEACTTNGGGGSIRSSCW